MKTITSLLVTLFMLIVPVTLPSHAGCGCSEEKEEEEVLYGTWINEEYDETMGIGKVVINPEGTYEAMANIDGNDPELSGVFTISAAWDDSDGNFWYKINLESAEVLTGYFLVLISEGGATLTISQSDNDNPESIDPDNIQDELMTYYSL